MAETALLQEELRLLRKLLDLTQQIDQALHSENLLSLADLLDSREKILARIFRCAESAGGSLSSPMKENDEGEMSGLINEIRTVHERITELDQEIKVRLEAERDGVHQRMLSARGWRRALQGYAPNRRGIPRFYDRKA